MIHIASFYS